MSNILSEQQKTTQKVVFTTLSDLETLKLADNYENLCPTLLYLFVLSVLIVMSYLAKRPTSLHMSPAPIIIITSPPFKFFFK